MKVAEVMTRRVRSVGTDALIADAVRLMLQNDISGLPVVSARGDLVGIVTEGDFLRRTETGTERRRPQWLSFLLGPGRIADEYVRTHGRRVEEVMTRDVATVTEDASLDEVVRRMESRRIKRLPVVRGRQIVGIISRANLLHALAALITEAAPSVATDTAIRERLLAELEKEPWNPRAGTDLRVRNGVVYLWGVIFDEREREALRVAAENVPGVKEVRDHLVWVEPYSGFAIEAPEETSDDAGVERR